MSTLQEIEDKIQKLREEWKKASAVRRQTIQMQARALQIAKEKHLKSLGQSIEENIKRHVF